MEWQPISTAPKDGSHVLLFSAKEYPAFFVGKWSDTDELWVSDDYWVKPTHWTPIPPFPEPPK